MITKNIIKYILFALIIWTVNATFLFSTPKSFAGWPNVAVVSGVRVFDIKRLVSTGGNSEHEYSLATRDETKSIKQCGPMIELSYLQEIKRLKWPNLCYYHNLHAANTLNRPTKQSLSDISSAASFSDVGVEPEFFRLSTDPDDTLSLQRAADTDRILVLRDDKVYTICAGINISKGVVGLGTGAKIKLCKGFSAGHLKNNFFINRNWSASVIKDKDILFDNLILDGTNNQENGAFHAIKVRMSEHVVIRNITCIHVGDCTALQASKNTLVEHSRAFDVGNVGFDHWEGPENAIVQESVVTCGGNSSGAYGSGVMFTASGTEYNTGVGSNVLSKNNRVFGDCQAGIDFNILWRHGSINRAVSEGDLVDAQGGSRTTGIRMIGNITNAAILNPTLLNGGGGNAIIIVGDSGEQASGSPVAVQVVNPSVVNWAASARNIAPLSFLGRGHKIQGAFVKGGNYPFAVRINDASVVVEGLFERGLSGILLTGGSDPYSSRIREFKYGTKK